MKSNQPLLPGVLPPSLLELDLGASFNQRLQPGSLPAGLRRLSMFPPNGQYNHPIPPGVPPPSLTHLHVGTSYNHPLQIGSLPDGLVQLYLSKHYNHPLLPGVLPFSLRELCFVSMANVEQANVLARLVSSKFDHPLLAGQLPDGLECLVLPLCYQQPIGVGVLPDSLLVLDVGIRCLRTRASALRLVHVLPRGLRWLRMSRRHHERVKGRLPRWVQCCWQDEEEEP